jgi:copper chaperone CopZ
MRAVLLLTVCGLGLQAEFLKVELAVERMDCASCLQTLEMGFKKLRGVEKVTVTAEEGAVFVLAEGNKITLERLRDAVKGVGFTPGKARVTARGRAVTGDGKWRFAVDGIGKEYTLSAREGETLGKLRAADGKLVTVAADSPVPPDPRTMPALDVLEILARQ